MEEKQTALNQDQKPQQPTQQYVTPVSGSRGDQDGQVWPISQSSVQKPSKWRYFFIVLGTLQVLGVAFYFSLTGWAARQAGAAIVYIDILALLTIGPVVGIVALLNVIALPIYVTKHRPHGAGFVLSILSWAVSALLVLYTVYIFLSAFTADSA